jgi:6,7-dimethyl-8-ribityllumazine synthase
MSGKFFGNSTGEGRRFAIVASRWNELVVKELVEGAKETFHAAGADEVIEVWVPGAWEIPVACQALIEAHQVDGIAALGCILQGQTTHAQLLAGDVGGALMSMQTNLGTPIAWGILTPDTQDQALDRAGLKYGNKGREAASSCIEMASLLEMLREPAEPEDEA